MHTPTISCSLNTRWPPDTHAACVNFGRRPSQQSCCRHAVRPPPPLSAATATYISAQISAIICWYGDVRRYRCLSRKRANSSDQQVMAVSLCEFTPQQPSYSSWGCRLARWVVASFVLKVMREWGGRGEQSTAPCPCKLTDALQQPSGVCRKPVKPLNGRAFNRNEMSLAEGKRDCTRMCA